MITTTLQSYNDGVWRCLYQLDRTLCDEVDGQKDADIPVTERTRVNCVDPLKLTSLKLFLLLQVLHKIRQEKVKEFTWADIYRHLEQVIKPLLSLWYYDRAKKQLILETQLSIQFIFWSHNVLHLASHLISKCLQVLDLVPWREFSQSEFLEFVVPSDVLPQVFFSVMSCQRFKSGNGCCPL